MAHEVHVSVGAAAPLRTHSAHKAAGLLQRAHPADDDEHSAAQAQLEAQARLEVGRESQQMPSAWRTLFCAVLGPFGIEIEHFVSNVGSEMRPEASWRSSSVTQGGKKLYDHIAKKDSGVGLWSDLTTYLHEVTGKSKAKMPLTNLRFSAGETLAHWSALQRRYDTLFFLLRVEPMLLATVYQGKTFRGESVLDILVAHENLPMIRRLAKFALFYRDPTDAAEARLCDQAWEDLAAIEEGPDKGSDPAWRRAWMADAWRATVNGRCDGTFFESPEKGGACYYGGTPVSIAVSLGNMEIVRFLTLEVGCTCRQCWECCDLEALAGKGCKAQGCNKSCWDCHHAENRQRLRELYPSSSSSTPLSCWLLQNWDVTVTARLDLPDAYGNSAGHMAVYHHDTPDVFAYLERLYTAGFGRFDNRSPQQERLHPELARPASSAGAAAATSCTLTVHRIPTHFTAADSQLGLAAARQSIELAHLTAGLRELAALLPATAMPDFTGQLEPEEDGERRCTLAVPVQGAPVKQSNLDFLCDVLMNGRRLEVRRSADAPLHFSLPLSVDIGHAASPRHLIAPGAPGAHDAALPCFPSGASAGWQWRTLTPALEREAASAPAFFSQTYTWEADPGAKAADSAPAEAAALARALAAGGGAAPALPAPAAAAQAPISQPATPEHVALQESLGVRRRLLDTCNAMGLTPLTLAVYMGKRSLFDAMWERLTYSNAGRGRPYWTWGGTSGIVYPLDQIDDLGQIQDDLCLTPAAGRAMWGVTRWWWTQCLGLPLSVSPPPAAGAAAAAAAPGAAQELGTPTPPPCVPLSPTRHFLYWKARGLGAALRRNVLKTLLWWLPLPWASRQPRQPTATDILVRYNRWVMLEPQAAAGAVARGMAHASGAASLASQALYRHHQREELTEEKAADVYMASMREAERLLATGLRRVDALEGKDLLQSEARKAGAPGGGEEDRVKASDSVLEQLAERKWERVYSVLFVRLALFRCCLVLASWGLLVTRSGAPLELGVCDPAAPPASCVAGRHALQGLVWALLAGAGGVFLVNVLPFARFVALPALAALARGAGSCAGALAGSCAGALAGAQAGAPLEGPESDPSHPFVAPLGEAEPAELGSREQMLYAAAHGGTFGGFYTFTLLCGSGLVAAGALVDLFGGGFYNAYLVYAFGALCCSTHLLYFLIGSTTAGPLLVMVGSTVMKQVLRWAHIFVPCVFALAFLQFIIDSGPLEPGASSQQLASQGMNTFFKDVLVGWVLDNSFNNFPSTAALKSSHAHGDSSGLTITLIFWIVIVYTLTIVLTSLLIAMLTDAFTEQQDRKSSFLIERLRACMLLESSLTGIERYFGAKERDRYYLLTRPPVPASDQPEARWLPHGARQLALRPYFMCLQPAQRPIKAHLGPGLGIEGGGGGGGAGGRGAMHRAVNLATAFTRPTRRGGGGGDGGGGGGGGGSVASPPARGGGAQAATGTLFDSPRTPASPPRS